MIKDNTSNSIIKVNTSIIIVDNRHTSIEAASCCRTPAALSSWLPDILFAKGVDVNSWVGILQLSYLGVQIFLLPKESALMGGCTPPAGQPWW